MNSMNVLLLENDTQKSTELKELIDLYDFKIKYSVVVYKSDYFEDTEWDVLLFNSTVIENSPEEIIKLKATLDTIPLLAVTSDPTSTKDIEQNQMFKNHIQVNNFDKMLPLIEQELRNRNDVIDQLAVANKLLYRLSSEINYIMQHDIYEISLKTLLTDFGKILNSSRSYIFEKRGTRFLLYDYYVSSECKCSPSISIDTNECDFLYDVLSAGDMYVRLAIDATGDELEYLESMDIKSIACVPIFNPDKSLFGFYGFDNCCIAKVWSDFELSALECIGATIGTIIYKMKLFESKNTEIKSTVEKLKVSRTKIENAIARTQNFERAKNAT